MRVRNAQRGRGRAARFRSVGRLASSPGSPPTVDRVLVARSLRPRHAPAPRGPTMADTAGSPPPSSSRKKRVRGGVDTSLIIEEPRKRKYMGVEVSLHPSMVSPRSTAARAGASGGHGARAGEEGGVGSTAAATAPPAEVHAHPQTSAASLDDRAHRTGTDSRLSRTPLQLGGPSTRHGGRSGSPNPATIPATDPEGFERVREQGTQLYERMVAQTDPSE